MPRPERIIDPDGGPVPRFAQSLRELRNQAGRPPYRRMQNTTFVSYSSLSRAAAGRRLPSWPTVDAFVTACGADSAEWRPRWELARKDAEEHARERAATPAPDLPDAGLRTPAGAAAPEPAGPAPDPTVAAERARTVAQFRAAVIELASGRDLRLISSTMRAPMSMVRLVLGWPEQAEPDVFRAFVRACCIDRDREPAWVRAWQAAVDDRRGQHISLPDPGAIHTPEAMRDAIAAMLRLTSVRAVAERMNAEEATVARVLGGAERVRADLFARFVAACGAPSDDVEGWLEAWRRVVAISERRQLIEVTAVPPVAPVQPPCWPPAGRPDPGTAPSYEALLAALRQLTAGAGLTCHDIERATAGRLAAPRVAAILDGVLPATGEQYVLLLRTCGLREQIPRWIAAWSRLRGSHLGNPPAPPGRSAALLNAVLNRLGRPRRPATGRCALAT